MSKTTRPEILAAALVLAEKHNYIQVTRNEIADAVGVSGSTVQYHFGTVTQLRSDLMRYAVKQRNARVVAQGLANGDKHALRADDRLKQSAREILFNGISI